MGIFKKICPLPGSKWLSLEWLSWWTGNEWLVRMGGGVGGGLLKPVRAELEFMAAAQWGSAGGMGS